MFPTRRLPLAAILLLAIAIVGARFTRAQSDKPVTVLAYGDTRFTDPTNVTATNPIARKVLIARMAEERPDAIIISGDVPWHGGVADDYVEFRRETELWRTLKIPIVPATGNHEFSQCDPDACIENWWTAFPELRGRRWHATGVGSHVRIVALDTMSPLVAGSEQRKWLEHEIGDASGVHRLPHRRAASSAGRRHPDAACAGSQSAPERARARRLPAGHRVLSHRVRIVVVAGHIHNYERFLQDDVVYLVSGGGGAVPYEVDRTPADLYKGIDFPNFHYVKMTIAGGKLQWRDVPP